MLLTIIPNTTSTPRITREKTINNLILNNSPPNNPNITVPNELTIGKPFTITVYLTDPDGDDMYFRFNASFLPLIHNIWFGPLQSNTTIDVEITFWGSKGTYTIGVQAKDTNESMSEWVYADLNFIKSKTNNIYLSKLLLKYQYIFIKLQQYLNNYLEKY